MKILKIEIKIFVFEKAVELLNMILQNIQVIEIIMIVNFQSCFAYQLFLQSCIVVFIYQASILADYNINRNVIAKRLTLIKSKNLNLFHEKITKRFALMY